MLAATCGMTSRLHAGRRVFRRLRGQIPREALRHHGGRHQPVAPHSLRRPAARDYTYGGAGREEDARSVLLEMDALSRHLFVTAMVWRSCMRAWAKKAKPSIGSTCACAWTRDGKRFVGMARLPRWWSAWSFHH